MVETRAEIFRIHLESRNQDSSGYALAEVAQMAEGFSGSEIEEVVVAALYTAFSNDRQMSGAVVREEIERTRPLSVTMAERIGALREWARERAVRAN